jgi:hypothetical protein
MSEPGTLDAIARDLAAGAISRRTALRRFAGMSVAAVLPGALFATHASAACPTSRRCKGRCCPNHAHCANGKCKCTKPYSKCGKSCRNLHTDAKNCGTCGHRCAAGETCAKGTCKAVVPDNCGNGVIDPGEECDGENLDNKICASLGYYSGALSCKPDCTFDTSACNCEPGWGKCDGACMDFNDVNRCGGCDNVCDDSGRSTQTQCYQEQCYYNCTEGYVSCHAPTGSRLQGCECEGFGCCGTECQTKHSNGIGGHWFDCQPLDTYNSTQALQACLSHTGSYEQCGDTSCPGGGHAYCTSDGHCWGYDGAVAGRVSSGAIIACPTGGDPAWT